MVSNVLFMLGNYELPSKFIFNISDISFWVLSLCECFYVECSLRGMHSVLWWIMLNKVSEVEDYFLCWSRFLVPNFIGNSNAYPSMHQTRSWSVVVLELISTVQFS